MSLIKSRQQHGFTIVELLIVIVVIAILAAISIVAYIGIQNRAYDTSVQSDLAYLAKVAHFYNADNGTYPTGGQLVGYSSSTTGQPVKATKSAYSTASNSMLYCALTDGSMYGFVARSKSSKAFYVSSSSGSVKEMSGGMTGTAATDCSNAGVSNNSGWWMYTTSWHSAVQG